MAYITEIYRNTFDSIAGIYKISSSKKVFFSISEDSKIFSEWEEATHSNLSKYAYPKNRKVTLKIGIANEESEWSEESESSEIQKEIDLEIETVSMKGNSTKDVTLSKTSTSGCLPDSSIVTSGDKLGIPSAKQYNPYDAIPAASKIYEEINSVINDSYGITVRYFKTSPDKRTEDYILNEYSLRNVVASECVKIMLTGSGMPSADIQFNPLMMDYPTVITVHILKSHFRCIFGEKSHPDTGDYIYVSDMFHNMYEINSVSDDTRFEKISSFWVVTLKQFEKRAERIYKDDDKGKQLFDDTEMVISGTGDFYEETFQDKAHDSMEKAAHTIQEQISCIDGNGYDAIRKFVSDKVVITDDILKNKAKTISETQYDMSKAEEKSVIYHNRYDMSSKDNERTISFIFNVNSSADCILFRAESPDCIMTIGIEGMYITVTTNSTKYKYQKIDVDVMYGIIFMYTNGISNMDLYEFRAIARLNFADQKMSCISKNIKKFNMKDSEISLSGFNGMITNIRIMNKTIPEESRMVLLTQTVIKDSQLLMLADNATKHLLVESVY